MALSKVVGQH